MYSMKRRIKMHVGNVDKIYGNGKFEHQTEIKITGDFGLLKTNDEIEFYTFEGLKQAGPVTVINTDRFFNRILVSSPITVKNGDLIIKKEN